MLVRWAAMSVFLPLLLHGQRETSDIYKEASPAVVAIEGAHKSGSGFLISADGVVVTNYHVVSGEKNVSVRFANGLELTADEVIAEDPQHDIVLLRVKGRGFPKLTLGDSDRVLPGDSVVVISNPFGLTASVSDGLVSGIREFDGRKMLQISAPISPGSSGGPVLDRAGRVVGVARATIPGGQNLNLAVPANVVAAIAANPKRFSDDPRASSSQSAPSAQVQEIARYIDAHLYQEARDQLRALCRTTSSIQDCILCSARCFSECRTIWKLPIISRSRSSWTRAFGRPENGRQMLNFVFGKRRGTLRRVLRRLAFTIIYQGPRINRLGRLLFMPRRCWR